MSENSPSQVFYASAKPEAPQIPKKEDSKLVKGVKNTLNKWWERVGPKSIENRFIQAHEKVFSTLNTEQRKQAYEQTAEKWKKAGKIAGVTATVIDASLVGLGIGLSVMGLKNPNMALTQAIALPILITPQRFFPNYKSLVEKVTHFISPFTGDELLDPLKKARNEKGIRIAGNTAALTPAMGSLAILLGSGPGHWLAHLAGMGAEQIGKMKAHGYNYVDSGKAAEHATKVGNAIGKAATETAKWAAEHPDEIRRTVETVSKVKKEQAESAQKIAQAKQKAADAKLDAEYADWIAHHPDKVYFEQSGTTPPSKAEYVEMKAREAAAKKANREAEERGVAKK